MTVLVTGGTGTLGRALVPLLPGARVLSRRPGPGHAVGDLASGAGIDEAVAGARTVVHLASMRRGDDTATARLVAATAPGTHLVLVSIVGADEVPLPYYRAKVRSEEIVAGSGRPWTLLRATQFPELLATGFAGLARTGVLPVLARTGFQPVAVDDVAARLAALASGPPAGRVADLGGPEIVPMAELAARWARIAGRRRRVLPILAPGRVAAALRAGRHLTPDHADGVTTFEAALEARR